MLKAVQLHVCFISEFVQGVLVAKSITSAGQLVSMLKAVDTHFASAISYHVDGAQAYQQIANKITVVTRFFCQQIQSYNHTFFCQLIRSCSHTSHVCQRIRSCSHASLFCQWIRSCSHTIYVSQLVPVTTHAFILSANS